MSDLPENEPNLKPVDHDLPTYYASYPDEDAQRDASTLIQAYLNDDLTTITRGKIVQPVCVPQMEVGFDMPFARAYAPALEELGISQEVFVGFIDGLNAAMIASPPLQVVDYVGLIIGFVPNDILGLVGAGIQAGAQLSIRVLSKTLTDRYLRAANERIFCPAGLRARICKSSAMRALAKVPWTEAPKQSRMQKLAGSVRNIGRRKSSDSDVQASNTLSGQEENIIDLTISDPLVRRMKPYEGFTLPLTLAVPPSSTPSSNLVKRLSDYAVTRRQKKLHKSSENKLARRQILAGVPLTREPTKKDTKMMKKLEKGKERDVREVRRKVTRDNRKESVSSEKVLWLVIVNEEEDNLIQGSERVDDSKDEVEFKEDEIATRSEGDEEIEELTDDSAEETEKRIQTTSA